jgi:hypothetical protein
MKTIWAIVAGLGAMMILSVAMVFVTMLHAPKPSATALSDKKTPALCNCKGQCNRQGAR